MKIDRSLTFKLTVAVFAIALFLIDLRGHSSMALARSIPLEQKPDPEREETKEFEFEEDGQPPSRGGVGGGTYCHNPDLEIAPGCEGGERQSKPTDDDSEDESENETENPIDDDSDRYLDGGCQPQRGLRRTCRWNRRQGN